MKGFTTTLFEVQCSCLESFWSNHP